MIAPVLYTYRPSTDTYEFTAYGIGRLIHRVSAPKAKIEEEDERENLRRRAAQVRP